MVLGVTENVINLSYLWLCNTRKGYPDADSVWDLQRHWAVEKSRLADELRSGSYEFSPQQSIVKSDGSISHIFEAKDALVLKAISLAVEKHVRQHVSGSVVHLKGHGGSKRAVSAFKKRLKHDSFVLKTDVKSFYESIDHHILYERLHALIPCKSLLGLIWKSLKRTVTFGGNYRSIERGLPRGSPLSPILATIYLMPLDRALEKSGVFYKRFADDFVIITKSRYHIRDCIKIMHNVLRDLKLEIAPLKTSIGRGAKGFDFLGYFVAPGQKIRMSQSSLEKSVSRINQLYEQGASKQRIGEYVKHFLTYCKGGLGSGFVNDIDVYNRLYALCRNAPEKDAACCRAKRTLGDVKCERYYWGFVSSFG